MKKNLQTPFNKRQYMLSRDFEIYYYNDRYMNSVGSHTHDYYEYYFFIGGNVCIEIAGKPQTLLPGDIVLIPPGTSHRLKVLDPDASYQRFIFWISESYLQELSYGSEDFSFLSDHIEETGIYIYHFDVFAFNALQTKVLELIEELHSDRFAKNMFISVRISDLLLFLNRTVYEMVTPKVSPEGHKLYQNLISYIEMHLDEELSLDHLASEFYVSKYHISHVFKEHLGISLHQYILKKRLAMSREAILSSTEISEVYLKCGFKDYSSFYRAFRKEFGLSPKEYREKYQMGK